MNIGVFGDSYADDSAGTWIDQLRSLGHSVGCFGVAGSSISYSARLLDQNCKFDMLIWCLTTAGRFSFVDPETDEYIHAITDLSFAKNSFKNRPGVLRQLIACQDYQKFVQNLSEEEFVYRYMVEGMMIKHKNLMIIPCFKSPLYLGFNLFDITNSQPEDEKFTPGHLTIENHNRLFSLIKNNLKPGYFTTSLDNFKS